jgi:hypothetical protein
MHTTPSLLQRTGIKFPKVLGGGCACQRMRTGANALIGPTCSLHACWGQKSSKTSLPRCKNACGMLVASPCVRLSPCSVTTLLSSSLSSFLTVLFSASLSLSSSRLSGIRLPPCHTLSFVYKFNIPFFDGGRNANRFFVRGFRYRTPSMEA